MAGIFNLFGDINNVNKGETMKALTGPKLSFGTPGVTGKSTNIIKPKGLSIRSTSDLNIPATPNLKGTKSHLTSKQHDYLKPKVTQLDSVGRPISPRKNCSIKTYNVEQMRLKELSAQKNSPVVRNTKFHKQSDKVVFKKPSTPKKFLHKSAYPEKENLASYYDFHSSFEDLCTIPMKSEFIHLIRMNDFNSDMDGSESDPEELFCSEIPELHIPLSCSDEEYEDIPLFPLPELSDADDDFL